MGIRSENDDGTGSGIYCERLVPARYRGGLLPIGRPKGNKVSKIDSSVLKEGWKRLDAAIKKSNDSVKQMISSKLGKHI